MSHNPGKDLADYLDTKSTSLTLGTNLFYGPQRAVSTGIPVEATFVIGTPGRPPSRVLGSTGEIRYGGAQVTTRSDSFASGLSLAQTIHNILQASTVTNYEDVRAKQSEPAFGGQDQQLRYLWFDNYELMWNSTD